MHFMKLLLGLVFIGFVNCYYHDHDLAFVENENQAILDDFVIHKPKNGEVFPREFEIKLDKLGHKLDLKFSKVDGVLNLPTLNNRVYVYKNNKFENHDFEEGPEHFAHYIDENNGGSATLIHNNDIHQEGLSKERPYRLIATINEPNSFNSFEIYPAIFQRRQKRFLATSKTLNHVIKKRRVEKKVKPDDLLENSDFGIIDDSDSTPTTIPQQVANQKSRGKRAINGQPLKLYVECAFVLDSTIYNHFISLTPGVSTNMVINNIRIFFSHLANGINQRFERSLSKDPDLSISIRMANILLFTKPNDTRWTMNSVVGVPGNLTYNGVETVLASTSLTEFTSYMNSQSLPFQYDHAFSFSRKDLFSNANAPIYHRAGVVGYTLLGGICGAYRYSLIEFAGFGSIGTTAHELAHNIGSNHDTKAPCLPSDNFIMTAVMGAYANVSNSFLFSNCTVQSFKSRLLFSNGTVTPLGSCLVNVPVLNDTLLNYYTQFKSGQLYSANDQCKIMYGSSSNYIDCEWVGSPICETIYCYMSGYCYATEGYGAVDGTSCGIGRVCNSGACVSSTGFLNSTISNCGIGTCLNGGTCINVNSYFMCNCQSGFTGARCDRFNGTTNATTTTRTSTTTTTTRTSTSTTKTTTRTTTTTTRTSTTKTTTRTSTSTTKTTTRTTTTTTRTSTPTTKTTTRTTTTTTRTSTPTTKTTTRTTTTTTRTSTPTTKTTTRTTTTTTRTSTTSSTTRVTTPTTTVKTSTQRIG